MSRSFRALLALPLLVACGSSQPPASQPTPEASAVAPTPAADPTPVAIADASAPATLLATTPAADPAASAAFASSIEAFDADLFAKLKASKGNVFYSPTSIEVALAMAAAGAHGDTAVQMQKVLHLGTDPSKTNASASQLLASWSTTSATGPTLNVANRLWGQQDYVFLPDYVQITRDSYGAELAPVDYKKGSEQARKAINTWVADKTNQKILDLIPAGVLTAQTRLVLTNAVYFKGTWAHAFKKEATTPQPFKSATGSLTVPMMHETVSASYADLPHAQLLSLPYKGDAGHALSMVIALPKSGSTLAAADADLDATAVSKWVSSETVQMVNVSLPKLKIQSQFELGPTLQQMGMPLAFTNAADFSGMSAAKGDDALKISNVIHKAFVDVNEEGTEAAAATGVVMSTKAAMAPMQTPVEFKVDHPFVFFIRDDKSGAILFTGKIENPLK